MGNLFILLAAIVILIVGFITVGVMNTLLLGAAGAGVYYYLSNQNGTPKYA